MNLTKPLRDQLLALGISENEHTPAGLSAYFPPEFDIKDRELDLEVLAALLLHFVERKLIIPAQPISCDAPSSGLHFCQFYRTDEELFDFTARFFRNGLKAKELCVWMIPEHVSVNAAQGAMAARIEDWKSHFDRGQVQVVSCRDCYLDSAGEMRPSKEILDNFKDKESEAFRAGFIGMRAAGDTSWIGSLRDLGPYLDYEINVTRLLNGRKITGLCTYSLSACSESRLKDILDVHHEAYLKLGPCWEGFRDFRQARQELLQCIRSLA